MLGSGHLAAGMAVVTKPFDLGTLSQKVRGLIGG